MCRRSRRFPSKIPSNSSCGAAGGALTVTVDGETQIIPEGETYRVVLDSDALPEPQESRGFGTKDFPHKVGKNHAYLTMAGGAAVATYFALDEMFESPDKP